MQSKKEGKDDESIQSSTTPDPGYQWKSNMQVHILFLHSPSTPGWGQRSNIFSLKVVMLHIKLIGMEHRETTQLIFCPNTHLGP